MFSNNVEHLITKTITTLQHFATIHHTSHNIATIQKENKNQLGANERIFGPLNVYVLLFSVLQVSYWK